MHEIKIWDTKAGKKVVFKPLQEGQLSMYYCGPTVYNYVHLGNLRPVIVFDLLSRLFKAVGYKIKVVSNYTDIDDKIIKRALGEHKTEKEISSFYIKAYEDSTNKLNLLPLYYHPKASEVIPDMIHFISKLLENGFAYQAGDDVNFRIDKVKDYGCVSHIILENNQAGKRIDVNDLKENPYDFALWKKTADEGIKFDSPFGKGRPGWHTECVVMIKKVFNQPTIDIHGGGFDLKFPHHENERAQSIGYDGHELASYWMHVGFLTAKGGVKMSKSLGNVVLAKDALEKYSGNALRLFFYSSHYRAPIAYSDQAMEQASNAEKKYVGTLQRLSYRLDLLNVKRDSDEVNGKAIESILDFLADDLNVANAIAVLEKEIKVALTLLRNSHADPSAVLKEFNTLSKIYEILGINAEIKPLTEEERSLLKEYDDARTKKDFAKSDALRKQLMEKEIL